MSKRFETLFLFGWDFDVFLTEMSIVLTVKYILEWATWRGVWGWGRDVRVRRRDVCVWRRWCLRFLVIIGAIAHRFGHVRVGIHRLEAWGKRYWSK